MATATTSGPTSGSAAKVVMEAMQASGGEASSAIGTTAIGAASPGRVNRMRQNWTVYEDEALAQKLQSQEIEDHLGGNRRRNHQIREDFPAALEEQTREVSVAEAARREHIGRQMAVTARDAELARRMAVEMERVEREHKKYEAVRDEVFAKRLQALESTKTTRPDAPNQRRRPEPEGTPPLPVSADGDVPYAAPVHHSRDTSFHDLRGGIRYDDDRYLVKMARPALVKAEPLYANNKPEHYAVSNVANPYSSGAGGEDEADLSHELLGAAGLSQRDLVVSKRLEAQLEQQKRDEELARRLQEQLSQDDFGERHKSEMEARDLELARELHAKEKAKLRRAKERSRLKKFEAQQQIEAGLAAGGAAASAALATSNNVSPDSRSGSRLSREEEVTMVPPARRPYLNREAIESHVSSSCSEQDVVEPQYENLRPPIPPMSRANMRTVGGLDDTDDEPIPPYMPMQQPVSKKSSSLEKRINRKKEKEGCKQQ